MENQPELIEHLKRELYSKMEAKINAEISRFFYGGFKEPATTLNVPIAERKFEMGYLRTGYIIGYKGIYSNLT